MKIGICGASGRMGRSVARIAIERSHTIGAAFEAAASPFIGRDAGELAVSSNIGVPCAVLSREGVAACDVVVDFSAPVASLALLEIACGTKTPVVLCTTGFDDAGKRVIADAAKKIPVIFSPNMSLGVNMMFKLVEVASKTLSEGFDIEVFEAHHRMKKDAPSGTARRLLEIIKGAIPRLAKGKDVYGREGLPGERADNEIGVQVLRGGDIVGEHTVFYISPEERIEITHRAATRDVFAKGAVKAAEFLPGKTPGHYTMDDVLGFK